MITKQLTPRLLLVIKEALGTLDPSGRYTLEECLLDVFPVLGRQ